MQFEHHVRFLFEFLKYLLLKLYFISVSSATTQSTTTVQQTAPLTSYSNPTAFCGTQIGFYPYPLDCSKFIECGAQAQVVGKKFIFKKMVFPRLVPKVIRLDSFF